MIMGFRVHDVQPTPNPNAVKFILDRAVADQPTSFFNAGAAKDHPLAAKLFGIPGVSSLLLLGDLWSRGQIKVDGDIVVAVPAKDALLVTGSRNAAGIARLRKFAADVVDGAYGLTKTLFVYRGGKFVALKED